MTPPATILRIPRRAALVAIAVLVGGASLVSFAESYRGLYDWAHEHGLSGIWSAAWPLQVDVFIAVGELALFVALADRWAPRSRFAAWTVTAIGLGVSVAGNVGHVASHTITSRVTAAIPPLAAAFALAVGLGVLKRVVEAHHVALEAAPEDAPEAIPDAAPKPPEPPLQIVPRTSPERISKPSPAVAKRMSPGDLVPYVQAVLETSPATIPSDLMKSLHIGREKATEALKLARRDLQTTAASNPQIRMTG